MRWMTWRTPAHYVCDDVAGVVHCRVPPPTAPRQPGARAPALNAEPAAKGNLGVNSVDFGHFWAIWDDFNVDVGQVSALFR